MHLGRTTATSVGSQDPDTGPLGSWLDFSPPHKAAHPLPKARPTGWMTRCPEGLGGASRLKGDFHETGLTSLYSAAQREASRMAR